MCERPGDNALCSLATGRPGTVQELDVPRLGQDVDERSCNMGSGRGWRSNENHSEPTPTYTHSSVSDESMDFALCILHPAKEDKTSR
jgi:hypothetical protein